MVSKNNILNRFLVVLFLFMILQTGCSTALKKPSLSSTEPGTGLSEITDPNQFPDFKDDYGKVALFYAIDNSKEYFKKIKSYPDSFKLIGFTPEKQIETLKRFRDGYLSSKNSQELSNFIIKNFRIFQAVGKESGGNVRFTGYGIPIFDESVTHDWKYSAHYGSIGVPVTPMRSIATEEGAFPPGGLAFAVIEKGQEGKSFFVLNHDARSTINTPTQADVFFGIGEDAINKAESLNNHGKLYYLLIR